MSKSTSIRCGPVSISVEKPGWPRRARLVVHRWPEEPVTVAYFRSHKAADQFTAALFEVVGTDGPR